jgi:phosphotransferase system enzyme I (PtsP)
VAPTAGGRRIPRGAIMAESTSSGTSRRLLRRLHDVMAAPASGQERLDQIVRQIAGNMVAEVCSVYVRRAGEVLELFATEGLNQEAVHNTRLRVGEGLVGEIAAHARPFALADAQAHPSFAYRPETGEDIYHSLLGVPILRGGRVLGVLVVQNRTKRHYTDEEVETLQTIAMVLAELVAGGELVGARELLPDDGIALLPLKLDGVSFNPGLAIGAAVLHAPRVTVDRMVADDPEAEQQRFRAAFDGMHTALDDMLSASDIAEDGEGREVLETYRMFAEDRGWAARISEAIDSGLTAEAAVQRAHDGIRARMSHVRDPYLRERLHDFEDLTNRMLHHLTGVPATAAGADLPEDVVLVARNMGPAELLDYDRSRLRALVLEEGSANAHVAIVARGLDIPVVGQARGVLDRIEALDPIIVDGDNAQIFIRPGEEVHSQFAASSRARQKRMAAYAARRDLPSITRDGVSISLQLNAGLLIDLTHLRETGADGIGLYRTEIPFMVGSDFPSIDTQAELYGKVLDQADGKTVVFRTLDIGGDKPLPYFANGADENPAIGWRAIRISLDRPAILRRQLRALIAAAAGRVLDVMFPMITEVAELDAARAILDLEIARAERSGAEMPQSVRVGAMLEVPALAWQLTPLLRRVDFLSVGSNDLIQFLFASDRGNPKLADRYDVLSPSLLILLRSIVRACDEAGVPVTLCGEMASRPLEAMALAGLGFRSISMAAPSIGPVKETIRSMSLGPLTSYLDGLLEKSDRPVRNGLRTYARDHGIVI